MPIGWPLLRFGLRRFWAEAQPRPILCCVREYEATTVDALRAAGFAHVGARALLVRHLTLRALRRQRSPRSTACGRTASRGWGQPQHVTTEVMRQPMQQANADDLDALLAVLPPRIHEAVAALPTPASCSRSSWTSGGARGPLPRARGRPERGARHGRGPGVRRRAHRHVRRGQPRRHRRTLHRISRHPQPPRRGRRPDLPRRPRRLRHDRHHPRRRRAGRAHPDARAARRRQDDDAARGGARARRRPGQARHGGRHLERDRRRRRHPAPGHRPRAAHAGGDARPRSTR